MAVSDRLDDARNATVAGGVLFGLSGFLRKLLAGIPLDRKNGEAEVTIMLSPGRLNTKIYIVVLSTDRKITRVCQTYSAIKLGTQLLAQMKANGMDVDKITQGIDMSEPLNDDEL